MGPLASLGLMGLLILAWAVWRADVAHDDHRRMLAGMESRLVPQPPDERPLDLRDLPARSDDPPGDDAGSAFKREPLIAAVRNVVRNRAVTTSPRRQDSGFEQTLTMTEPAAAGDPVSAGEGPSDNGETLLAASSQPVPSAGTLAERGYAALEEGDRQRAAEYFRRALASGETDARAAQWREQLRSLGKRWNADAYALVRSGASASASPTVPTLGGDQFGGRLGYVLNPLARQPAEVQLRLVHAPRQGAQPQVTEAVAGLGWRPLGRSGPEVAVERRAALQGAGRNAFQLRLSGGAATGTDSDFDLSFYADAGIVGLKSTDLFVGGQGFAGYRMNRRLSVGGGAWGGAQDADRSSSLLEVGPEVTMRVPVGRALLEGRGSYRLKVAGDAAAGDGPALAIAVRY